MNSSSFAVRKFTGFQRTPASMPCSMQVRQSHFCPPSRLTLRFVFFLSLILFLRLSFSPLPGTVSITSQADIQFLSLQQHVPSCSRSRVGQDQGEGRDRRLSPPPPGTSRCHSPAPLSGLICPSAGAGEGSPGGVTETTLGNLPVMRECRGNRKGRKEMHEQESAANNGYWIPWHLFRASCFACKYEAKHISKPAC